MRRLFWGAAVTILAQIALILWNLLYLIGGGSSHSVVTALQYLGVAAGSAVLFYLARSVRRLASESRILRSTALVAMCLCGFSAVLVFAGAVFLVLQNPVEAVAYGVGRGVAALAWLLMSIAGFAAQGTRPRPVLPATVLLLLFLLGISPGLELPYNLAGPSGEPDTSNLVHVEGGELHPGQIYGLTVWAGPATVADFLYAQWDRKLLLVPQSTSALAQEGEMLSHMLAGSEVMAKAVGLQLAGRGKGASVAGTGVVVSVIRGETPAAAAFQPGDVIVGLGDAPVTGWTQLLGLLEKVGPGEQLRFIIRRDGQPHTVHLTTAANPSNPARGLVGITGTDEVQYDIPVPITMKVPPDVGGPSLGLALTLQVVDQLTPGGITGKWRVAATGEILPGGAVGPVGNVQYKAWGAERTGATVMFVPRQNYQDALSGATTIQVVPVDTVQDALTWLKGH